MKTMPVIMVLSIFSMFFLIIAFIYLSSIGPLEQNRPMRELISEVLSKDPKAQRSEAKGHMINHDTAATEILSTLGSYMYYPLIAIGLSVLSNGFSLILLKYNQAVAGSLLMCAAILSFFTIIPPTLQAISGFYLLRKERLNRNSV